jgi:coenzyme F420-reducing hydrogenase beta subunit
MFTPMACNSCTDVFAHCADIVIMDAWLPEYTKDYRGHTLVIVRTNELNEFAQNIHSLSVEKIVYQKVFDSQKAVVAGKNAVALGSRNPFVNAIAKKRVAIQKLSHKSYEDNKKQIDNLLMDIKKIEKIYRRILLPKRIIFKIYRILKGIK